MWIPPETSPAAAPTYVSSAFPQPQIAPTYTNWGWPGNLPFFLSPNIFCFLPVNSILLVNSKHWSERRPPDNDVLNKKCQRRKELVRSRRLAIEQPITDSVAAKCMALMHVRSISTYHSICYCHRSCIPLWVLPLRLTPYFISQGCTP
jgi:hypothetical protein